MFRCLSVLLYRSARHSFILYRLRVRSGIWLEERKAHGCYWAPRQVLTSFLRHVMMSTTSAHHAVCASISERHVCVASCSFLSLAVGLFLGPARTLQSVVPGSPSPSTPILTFFRTVQFLFSITFFTLTAALRPWFYRFVCDTRAPHCPCQLETGPVSSNPA